MKNLSKITFLLAVAAVASSCNHLSDQAKDMVGVYYQPAISENEPIMELNDDGTCIVHAIKPNVMSYTVNGQWNVENDSLMIETDGKVAEIAGDTTQVTVGEIPLRISYAITSFNGLTLTLNREGADYAYSRRGHNEELENSK